MLHTKLPCGRTNCRELASRYPHVLMVALGETRGQSSPLTLIIPMPLCLKHQPEFDPQHFLDDEARRRLARTLMAQRRMLPDFDEAWHEWHRIGDKDWVDFHRLAN